MTYASRNEARVAMELLEAAHGHAKVAAEIAASISLPPQSGAAAAANTSSSLGGVHSLPAAVAVAPTGGPTIAALVREHTGGGSGSSLLALRVGQPLTDERGVAVG